MTIIYYDKRPVDELCKLMKVLKEKINDEVLFIPKDFDVILNASEDQLMSIKNTIEAALKLKEIT
jgi:hypothetical protein